MRWDAKKGHWVQISQVVLEQGQRAPNLPEDTAKTPLTLLVKGFLMDDANLGDTVTITTVVGRTVTGKLVTVDPSYDHSFGAPPKGFMSISSKLREILQDVR